MTHWKECKVEGCRNVAVTRGWCQAHYNRWREFGDVLADRPIRQGIYLTHGPHPNAAMRRYLSLTEPSDKSRIQDGSTEIEG